MSKLSKLECPGILIGEGSLRRILGRVLTIVETIGLTEKQEEAVKSLITQATYLDNERHYQVAGSLADRIREIFKEKKIKDPISPMTTVYLEDIN